MRNVEVLKWGMRASSGWGLGNLRGERERWEWRCEEFRRRERSERRGRRGLVSGQSGHGVATKV